MHGIECSGLLAGEPQHFHCGNAYVGLFKTFNDFSNQPSLYPIGFDKERVRSMSVSS